MESKMRVKVVMLPTKQKAPIGQFIITAYQYSGDITCNCGIKLQEAVNMDCPEHHLYFISDEEIQVGDWYIWKGYLNKIQETPIIHCYDTSYGSGLDNTKVINNGRSTKIVATTDTSLGLPLIPQSFVEKYCKKNGNIKEAMIETEYVEGIGSATTDSRGHRLGDKIKTRKDNTVIVSRVKDSWTREEVIELLYTFGEIMEDRNSVRPYYRYEEWIEQNL